jgi:hypothetical protein
MKFISLIAVTVTFLPASLSAPQSANTSVCLSAPPPGVLLNICQHARGMVTGPQPTLYLRVYQDGRGEYETNNSENVLVKKEFRISEEALREIAKLGAAEGVQTALERYPVYNHGIDSSRELTLDIYSDTNHKSITLTNFYAADRENKKRYPASLISLMEKAEELWTRAHGIVTEPPSITFCTLMADREYLTGKHVRIWADLELGTESGSYLHDPECDRPEMGQSRTQARIGFEMSGPGATESRLVSVPGAVATGPRSSTKESIGQADSVREILRQKGFETDVPRVRVMIEGILRQETDSAKHDYPYRFIIERFLSVDKIVVPYAGELKEGWTYSDAIDHVRGTSLKLSSPLKPLIHHAQLIEWTNADKFPALRRTGRKYLTFRVVAKETRQMEKYRWNDVYTCELLEVTEA